jgi:hypothetical protein
MTTLTASPISPGVIGSQAPSGSAELIPGGEFTLLILVLLLATIAISTIVLVVSKRVLELERSIPSQP